MTPPLTHSGLPATIVLAVRFVPCSPREVRSRSVSVAAVEAETRSSRREVADDSPIV